MTEVLTPNQLAEQGKQSYQNGEFESAARLFAQAAEGFTHSEASLDAAEMKNNASVAWLQAGNAQEAYNALTGTAQLFADAKDFRRQGLALGNEGAALEALSRFDEAVEKYQRSADVLKQANEGESRASVMKSLSALELKRGKPYDAVYAMQSGLAGIEKPSLGQRILKAILRFRPW
jgi:tetratricopeptide (TPR) repeat protein